MSKRKRYNDIMNDRSVGGGASGEGHGDLDVGDCLQNIFLFIRRVKVVYNVTKISHLQDPTTTDHTWDHHEELLVYDQLNESV